MDYSEYTCVNFYRYAQLFLAMSTVHYQNDRYGRNITTEIMDIFPTLVKKKLCYLFHLIQLKIFSYINEVNYIDLCPISFMEIHYVCEDKSCTILVHTVIQNV